jgi:Mg/Co/Ni transporter MgtE
VRPLLTACIASRVVGRFEGSIAQLTALAALMPIVASIGGNTVNQTVALERMGRDPVMGSSILLTAIADSMGLLIFLALASALLYSRYDGSNTPEPPADFGRSLCFGSESTIRSTAS